MKNIYCLSSSFFGGNDVSFAAADNLQIENVSFVKISSPDKFYNFKEDELFLIYPIKGIYFVKLIEDMRELKEKTEGNSDFNLGVFLELISHMGKIKKISVIAIPEGKTFEEIRHDLEETIKKLV